MGLDEMARDFASNSSGMMGEVMNLEDFLDELSEPDPKLVNNNETASNNAVASLSENINRSTSTTASTLTSNRYMFNPLANLEMMFNSSNYYQQQQQQQQNQQIQMQHSTMISNKNGMYFGIPFHFMSKWTDLSIT